VSNKFKGSGVATISLAHLIHDVYSSFLAPLLPILISKFGLNLTTAGVLTLVQRIPSFLSIFIGAVVHKVSWRWVLILAPVITGVGGSLIGITPNIILLAILLFTMGICSATFHVTAPVVIKYFAGPKSGKGMSWYMLGGEGARTLGPLLIVSAVSWWGLEGTWRLVLPVIAAGLTLYFIIENIPYETITTGKKHTGKWWNAIVKNKSFFIALGAFMLFRSLMKGSLATFLPTYMGIKGSSLFTGAMALSVMQFAAAFGSFIMGGISDKFGRIRTLWILAALSPIFMILFVFSGLYVQFITLVFLGIVLYATSPVLLAMVLEQGSDQPAMMNAGFTTINFTTNALAVIFTGVLGDVLGLETTLHIAAFLGIGAIPTVFILKKYSYT
jgi:FSR family fosmidomycin resistance protein-like MFS transporter